MVCAKCAPQWFDGRETKEQQNAPGLPEFAAQKPAADAESDADTQQDAEMINLDPEVPAYSSAEAMIQQALDWKPDYTETPEFWTDRSQAKRIITPQNAYIIFNMMQDVINRGTGRRARSLERHDIGGKTGTSNNRRDAWFSGFNSEIVGIAWSDLMMMPAHLVPAKRAAGLLYPCGSTSWLRPLSELRKHRLNSHPALLRFELKKIPACLLLRVQMMPCLKFFVPVMSLNQQAHQVNSGKAIFLWMMQMTHPFSDNYRYG
jgi:hypothetical protein